MPTTKRLKPLLVFLSVGVLAAAIIIYATFAKRIAERARETEASRLRFVDNFDDGVDPNLVGGNQAIATSEAAQCRSSYTTAEFRGRHGQSLEINYNVPKGKYAIWRLDLNELDVSAADTLVFWIKSKDAERANGKYVLLEDGSGEKKEVSLSRYTRLANKWKRVAIPTRDFGSLNLNKMTSFALLFEADGDAARGAVYIDDVAFKGKPEVVFYSIRDNIVDFPERILKESADALLQQDDKQMLRQIAKDAWGFFSNSIDERHHLVVDFIQIYPKRHIGDYTSPTNIGLYMLSIIGAWDLGFIDKEEAALKLRATLDTLERLPKWNNLFYNYYNTTNLQVSGHFVSSIDNGWLAAGLIVTRQAFPEELAERCGALLDAMDFSLFYDKKTGQMDLGYDAKKRSYSGFHYGMLATESRVLSFIAIGKADVPAEHWFRIFRTLPAEWDWQSQRPEGEWADYEGVRVFEGYYTYKDIKVMPSWGGSLFEFLMPTLVINEKGLAEGGLGLNNIRALKAHIEFATKERRYPVWGISPSSTPDSSYGGYAEFGVAALGSKGYKDEGVITPHVSFLALDVGPREAIENIRRMLALYGIYGEYGPYDSFDVDTNEVSFRYLALDEGMLFAALSNYLTGGKLKERFHKDPIAKKAEPLLAEEAFFGLKD